MSEATSYSCPQCRATLKLDPSTGKLACDFCGGSFEVEEIEKKVDETYARKTAKKKKKGQDQEQTSAVPEGLDSVKLEDWDAYRADDSLEQFDDMVGYVCNNCGAQVVADKLTVATSCQYCGSSVVVDERLAGGLKPHYVIPFKIKAQDIAGMLTDFYKKRPLLPKDFFTKNQVGEVQGLYVPFWLYDGRVDGGGTYVSHENRYYSEGSYDCTETTYYESERIGYVGFDNVPVDASERIDDDLMDSIEPFDYKGLKPFQAGYLTGFVAERFDQSPRQVFDRAGSRMKRTADAVFEGSLDAGDYVTSRKTSFDFSEAAVSYVLLPVYLFNCNYMGKHYRYAVNGQTGQIVGEVPCGKMESLVTFLKGWGMGLVGGVVAGLVLGLVMWVLG